MNVTNDILLKNSDVEEMAEELLHIYRQIQGKNHLSLNKIIDDILYRPKCGNLTFSGSNLSLFTNNLLRAGGFSGYKFESLLLGNPPIIRYAFKNYHPNINKFEIESAISFAFEEWQEYIPIDFIKVNNVDNAIIKISWEPRSHSCVWDFDGRRLGKGNVVAHAGYPNTASRVFGQIHFDMDEVWSVNPRNDLEIDLQTVALHEIGHVLGLEHSTIEDNVMYEDYVGVNRRLHNDDIQIIQSVYGSRFRNHFV